MFEKILIANRGEIAVRIIRACRNMGIQSVAVYSKEDQNSLHTQLADQRICIGEGPAKNNYLNMDQLITAAINTGADAIHPGYGFLSENSEFVRRCKENGIAFIGPDADVIDRMGNKSHARKTMMDAGVPVVPGTREPVYDAETGKKLAREIGYPVIIKASSGGGGPAINEMLKKVGVESHFANGLRVTDDATMEIVQQVLAGKVNKDLVAKLRGRGVGLCGMDGQMLRCTELDPQLGHVGEIVHVDATLIASLLDGGFIPVIATVGMDDLGQAYNVNADTAAAQIAIALKAEKLVSMTDIAGLLRDKDDESTLIPEVEVSEIEGYKSAGIIAGGMIPKIGGMADAIYQGVHEAVIIDGRVPHSILLELFSDRGSGTRFYRRSHRE